MAKQQTNGAATEDNDKDVELEPVGPNVDDDDTSTDDDKPLESKEDDEVGHSEASRDKEDNEGEDKDDKLSKSKSRKIRQREARDRDKRELLYLRTRVDQLENQYGHQESRLLQNEATALDARINTLKQQLTVADEVFAEASAAGNKKDIQEAQRLQREINEKLNRLNVARGQLQEHLESATEEVETRQQQRGPQLDPAIVSYAKTWMEENDWYDPKDANNKETQRIKRIDAQILKEGFDPRDQEYWDELTNRVKAAFPHRFEDRDEDDDEDEDERRPAKVNKGKGPKFTTRGREVTLKPNQVAISPARKAALIEAGVWDDPVERQRYLKSYAKYDRDNGSRA